MRAFSDADLERLADLLAARLAALLAPPPHPKYADKDSNPIGTARAFLDAARAGRFPTFRRARRVTALWSDVEAAIEADRRKRKPPASHDIDIDKLLDGAKPKKRQAA